MGRLFPAFCLAVFAAGVVSAQPEFRRAAWGINQAQVRATESNQPSQVRESKGEIIVRYDGVKLAGLRSRVVYISGHDIMFGPYRNF